MLCLGRVCFSAQEEVRNQATSEANTKIASCIVVPLKRASVPALQAGQIQEYLAQEAKELKAGDVIAKLHDEVELAQLEEAKLQLELAKLKAHQEAANEMRIAETQAVEEQFLAAVSASSQRRSEQRDMELKRLLRPVDRLKIQESVLREEKAILHKEVDFAEARAKEAEIRWRQRSIVAPIDGVFLQKQKQLGEWIEVGEAIGQIVNLEKLALEGSVDAQKFRAEDLLGKKVNLVVTLKVGSTSEFEGEISFVSPVIETTGKYRILAQFSNRQDNGVWVVVPGMKGDIVVATDPKGR